MHNAVTAAVRYENNNRGRDRRVEEEGEGRGKGEGEEEHQQKQQQAVQRSQNKQNRCALFSCCCGAAVGEGGQPVQGGWQPGSLAYCGFCRPTWPLEVSVKKPTTRTATATATTTSATG